MDPSRDEAAQDDITHDAHILEYTVVAASSYSNPYRPERILEDRPGDSSSRWSTEVKPGETWILLKLKSPSIVASVTFGKHHKPHPCNLSEFKVFIGPTPEHMNLVMKDKLRDDNIPQTFRFTDYQDSMNRSEFPCLYVKIMPLSAQMPKYNASIWHLTIQGIDDPTCIRRLGHSLQNSRESEAMRLILKHMRQRGLGQVFSTLMTATGIQLEDPLVSSLYESVVDDLNYKSAERLLDELGKARAFSSYLTQCSPRAHWQRLHIEPPNDGRVFDAPCRRGGHTMCIDEDKRLVYLLGGWDGARELPDFWAFDLVKKAWRVLSLHTRAQDGPGARSCHAMALDKRTSNIYVLGRYVEFPIDMVVHSGKHPSVRTLRDDSGVSMPSDFYRYSTSGKNEGRWDQLSLDTAAEGGPHLLFDHQMVVDSDSQRLYVFGGHIAAAGRHGRYSGMYCYDLAAHKWSMLFDDRSRGGPIPSRHGHCMVLDQASKTIYIFSGFRDGAPLSDMWTYSVATNEASLVTEDIRTLGGPEAGFQQRSVFDAQAGEIRVFSLLGLTRNRSGESDALSLSSWAYKLSSGTWMPLETDDQRAMPRSNRRKLQGRTPRPRFGHQIVYDQVGKTHLMFGGDPGKGQRLDDLWAMTLERPSINEALHRCRFLLRRQSFIELAATADIATSLSFLREVVGPIVNQNSTREVAEYHALMEILLRRDGERLNDTRDVVMDDNGIGAGDPDADGEQRGTDWFAERPVYGGAGAERAGVFKQRMKLFESLIQFVNADSRQPAADLMDMLF